MVKCIMVQGTSSNAGKSVLVAALCRIYSRKGLKVTPFKSQNMSLNSYTTKENGEIAIAQVLQAEACDVEPSIHMNPVLLKPKGNFKSQVIIQGKVIGDMNFYDYQHKFRDTALKAINESLAVLKEEYDLIIIEGAGSPAEINMRKEDIANMEIAHLADAEVLLVADIDRGGVFASIAGTFMLLDEYDRKRLKAVIINKFSGNLDILMPGIDKIEKIINSPVLGVLPYDHDLHLPEEDSASLKTHKFDNKKDIIIGVLKLPKIANFTDIDPFEFEEDVGLKMINLFDDFHKITKNIDGLIIPGTRNSVDDLIQIKQHNIAEKIRELSDRIPIIGICGGYQILGEKIIDENKKESEHGTVEGLGLLKVETNFNQNEKIVEQSEGVITNSIKELEGEIVRGYEIHEGTTKLKGSKPLLKINKGFGNTNDREYDGACENNVIGTYFHGIFHNYNFRQKFLNDIRKKKGLNLKYEKDPYETKKAYSLDKLAKLVQDNLDMEFIDELIRNKHDKDN
ncbi:cobyric acid synthase CobQ [Methanobrevibacter filiformis]|uniref:Probable cobyric acid synthase n=1 Tax=Methanobrevibacter filiformis TaxID=55758 RepID=A0A166CXL5_9EURY|nr:cobyric acid synthase CobQ [Methanobrevibacter filiformis]KZX17457.1 cobyric acid synthase [Methanobrevibacter filiformis]